MKIAIVTDGFKGVAQQKQRWMLERDIAAAKQRIVNTERNLQAWRTALANMRERLDGIPNREIT